MSAQREILLVVENDNIKNDNIKFQSFNVLQIIATVVHADDK